MTYIFDIECYKNYFSSTFKNIKNGEVTYYEIFHDINNNISNNINKLNELYLFIKSNHWLIGYNSHFYDNQLLNFLYKNYQLFQHYNESCLTYELKLLSDRIIENNVTDYKYNLPFKEIDLMKIGNINKSLKSVASNLKHDTIQDLPINEKLSIKLDDLNIIRKYNLNDIIITEKLYNTLIEDIKVRFELSKDFNIDFTNDSVSGITNKILKKYYFDITGLSFDSYKHINTKRSEVLFSDIIFDDIRFKSEKFNNILNIFKSLKWNENKDNEESINIDYLKLTSGYGGIHSVDNPGIFESNENYQLIDLDIKSGYASLIINKRICPEHINTGLINKYNNIKSIREDINCSNIKSNYIKRILTMLYGKTYTKDHWMYDIKAALQVAINTQLYILMLIEELLNNNIKIISVNTDGVLCNVEKCLIDKYCEIYKKWCDYCKFDVTIEYFNKYIRKDISNYIAIKDDSLKLKGIFSLNKDYNSNLNNNVINIALNEYFINKIPIKNTIINHNDIYDFCSSGRADDNYYNEIYYIDNGLFKSDIIQKNVRYYVSTKGCSLFKVNKHTSGKINYCEGKNVTLFNNFIYKKNMNEYFIDYLYYIREANKIVNIIENNNEQRKLF